MAKPAETKKPPAYVTEAQHVIAAEGKHLRKIRASRFANSGKASPPLFGLALSGGGIRSAAFAMGAMHSLVRHDRMRWSDYLSTVSGGGYAGTALTWMLSTYEDADVEPNTHAGPGNFPLSGWRQGVRGSVSNEQPRKFGAPLRQLDRIRQRSEYLTPGDIPRFEAKGDGMIGAVRGSLAGDPDARRPLRLDAISVIGVVLRSMLAGFGVYLPLLFVLMIALGGVVRLAGSTPAWLLATLFGAARVADWETCWGLGPWAQLWTVVAAVAIAAFTVVALVFSALSRLAGPSARVACFVFFALGVVALVAIFCPVPGPSIVGAIAAAIFALLGCGALLLWKLPAYTIRTYAQWTGGHFLRFAGAFLVLASLPVAVELLGGLTLAAVLSGGGAAGGAIRLVLGRVAGPRGRVSVGLLAVVAGVALCFGVLMLGYMFADDVLTLSAESRRDPGALAGHGWATIGVLASWGGIAGALMDLNYVTPHRMYRDRLMEAFLPPAPKPRAPFVGEDPERAKLADMCGCHPDWGAGYPGPYQLINANIVLTGSKVESRRGRGGDSFILSPLWCGSTATGWRKTADYGTKSWFADSGDAGGRSSMTVASAMAISAAAANPNAGPYGRGVTRVWPIAFLMNFLGLRLGYSEVNPWRPSGGLKKFVQDRLLPPRPTGLWPGIPHLAGGALDERALFVELTDGGHFENLGLYELLRREIPVIVCVDAVQDGDYAFADLANAIQRARVDFGVNIDFLPGFGLDELTPPRRDSKSAAGAGTAVRGFALAELRYAPTRPATPPGNEPLENAPGQPPNSGVLIYIKSTLIAGLPADLYAYRAANPDFPHQTTADQFFDEAQFEAYRELGYRLASQMLTDGDAKRCIDAMLPPKAPTPGPPPAVAPVSPLRAIFDELKEKAKATAAAKA